MENRSLSNVKLLRSRLNWAGVLILFFTFHLSAFSTCPGSIGIVTVNGVQAISSLFSSTGGYCQVDQNIDVLPGGELIIDKDCEFYENVGINVHIGGILTLGDLSATGDLVMKNKCNELWSGISTITDIGTSAVSTVRSAPNFNHAFTIEKAFVGIRTPLAVVGSYGAKVDLHDVTFMNCNKALDLIGKSLAWNVLLFDECRFIWTDDYKPYQDVIAQGGSTTNFNFPSMIRIAMYIKCTFLKCEILNEVNYSAIGNGDFTKQEQRGTGVEMIDANVNFMASDCTPSSQYCLSGSTTCYEGCNIGNGNVVRGFGTGMHCKNNLSDPQNPTTINLMTLFENNVYHYKSERSHNSYTYGCWFRNDPSLNWKFYGIYFDKCIGFTIEKSDFVTLGNLIGRAWYGIVHFESGPAKCVIKNNGFLSGNSFGDLCYDDKEVIGVSSRGNTQGLEFTCNSFNLYGIDKECPVSFITDWYIGPGFPEAQYTTNSVQGDSDESASNNFSSGCFTSTSGNAKKTNIYISPYISSLSPCTWSPVNMAYYEFGADGPSCYYDNVHCAGFSGSNITFPQSVDRRNCNSSEPCISTCGTSSGGGDNGTNMIVVENLYPNPTNGVINIDFSEDFGQANDGELLRIETVGLIDNQTHVFNSQLQGGIIILDLSGISNGLHSLNIYQNGASIYNSTIVKE